MKETAQLLDNPNEKYTVNDPIPIQRVKISPGNTIFDYLYFVIAVISYCIVACFQSSISPITDVLQSELAINLSEIGLLSALTFLTYFLFQIPGGILLQKYSYKLMLLIIMIGLSISVLLFGAINSFVFASILRTIGGIFSAPAWVTIVTVTGQNFGNNKIPWFAGIAVIISFGTNLACITLQGYLYEQYQMWREVFYAIGIVGILTTICAIICMVCENTGKQPSQKWIMALSFSNLSQKKLKRIDVDISVDDMENISGTFNQLKKTMQNYLNWVLGILGFCFFTIQTSVFGLWLIPYLMLKLNYSRSYASLLSGMCLLCLGIGGLLFGYISTTLKKRKILLIIGIICCFAVFVLIYLDERFLNDTLVIVICVVTGIGVGANTILFTLVREYNMIYDIEETATGFMNAVMVSSGLISQFLIGFLIDYHWNSRNENEQIVQNQSDIRQYDVTDYNFAFSCVLPITFGIGFIMSVILKETNGKL